MRFLRYGVSLMLALTVFLSGSTLAFVSNAKAETIAFYNFSLDELQMNELAEKGEDKILLAVDGESGFVIMLPKNCSEALMRAAETLRYVVKQMTGADIPVSRDSAISAEYLFRLDTAMDIERPTQSDIADGYRTVVDDSGISICGGTEDGTVNGIYGFIEDVLGCIFLTPDDTYIPKQSTVWISKNDELSVPATLWRDVYAFETVQNKWAEKLRLNGIDSKTDDSSLTIEQLQYEGWGTWCHNCYQYLSPEDYFDTHPEYFSEKNGERVTTYGGREAYLCLSNPEVFEIVKNALDEKIAANPDKLYWDFSGNDNSSLAGCECAECRAADKAAGGTGMGTLLPFLNKLAQAFPDKYISSLAYFHTLKAPKNIKAEPNVVIKLCSMPGDQASSYLYGENRNSRVFKEQVEEWSKITDKLVVWDYVVNFSHLVMPFPNFSVQADNQKFYEENGIIGVFHQASREKGGEFACLRAYVLSHLMWEGSDMDVEKCVSKYVSAYFGDAAPMIIQYMNLCAAEHSASNKTLGLYDGLMAHYNGYLSKSNVERYKELIDEAKAAVKGEALYENRVEEVELSIAYATVLQPEIGNDERQAALDLLNALCDKHGITMICEWDSLENFNQNSLTGILAGEKKQLMLPYLIGGGICAGTVLIAAVAIIVFKAIQKRRSVK